MYVLSQIPKYDENVHHKNKNLIYRVSMLTAAKRHFYIIQLKQNNLVT